eukprot:362056-Chlamydomonas_euryale.AAC.1
MAEAVAGKEASARMAAREAGKAAAGATVETARSAGSVSLAAVTVHRRLHCRSHRPGPLQAAAVEAATAVAAPVAAARAPRWVWRPPDDAHAAHACAFCHRHGAHLRARYCHRPRCWRRSGRRCPGDCWCWQQRLLCLPRWSRCGVDAPDRRAPHQRLTCALRCQCIGRARHAEPHAREHDHMAGVPGMATGRSHTQAAAVGRPRHCRKLHTSPLSRVCHAEIQLQLLLSWRAASHRHRGTASSSTGWCRQLYSCHRHS